MADNSNRRAQLSDILNTRRLELGLRWRDVAARAGLSTEAIRALRHDGGGARELTIAGVERALRLETGSIRRFLDGAADHLPEAPEPPPDSAGTWLQRGMRRLGMTDEQTADFAIRMGWASGAAPPPETLTLAQWRAVAREVGLPLEGALEAFGEASAARSAHPPRSARL